MADNQVNGVTELNLELRVTNVCAKDIRQWACFFVLVSCALVWAGKLHAQRKAQFEVISIKAVNDPSIRGHWIVEKDAVDLITGLGPLISRAFGVPTERIVGMPGWAQFGAGETRFQVRAKAAAAAAPGDVPLMLQSLLADRFRLAVHRETRAMRHYELVRAKDDGSTGPFLPRIDDCGKPQPPPPLPPGFMNWEYSCGTLRSIAGGVSAATGELVVDTTGIDGSFQGFLLRTSEAAPDRLAPSITSTLWALPEQWGVKVQESKSPIDVLVVDAVQRPTSD